MSLGQQMMLPTIPEPLPRGISIGDGGGTPTALFNRIAVQVNETVTHFSGATVSGFVDIQRGGVWSRGTELQRRYDAAEYYGNAFNLVENTPYPMRLTLQYIVDGAVRAEFATELRTTTLSSATPQSAERVIYLNPVTGNNNNAGTSPASPKQWFTYGVAAGDTIVIMNGDFSAGTSGQRNLIERNGTATNWIRVIPYNKYSPGSGNDATETFRKLVPLNGTWEDETSARTEGDDPRYSGGTPETVIHSGMPGVWSMELTDTHRLIGVVRDEETGWQLYHHNSLSTVSVSEPGIGVGFDPADFPQLGGAEVQGWFIRTTAGLARLYIRTHDGNEPEADRYVAGYWTGPLVRESSYIAFYDCTFEMLANTSNSTTLGGNNGMTISAADGNDCHHIYLIRPTFKDCVVFAQSTAAQAGRCYDILFDEPTFLRKGVKEYFIDRCDYTEADPYVADLGYHPVKAALWDVGAAISAFGVERLTIRNANCDGYDLFTGNTSATYATFNGGKNLDIHGGWIRGNVTGAVDFGNTEDGDGINVNAALWNIRIDDSAEPIAMSPANSGPLWIFNLYGDRILHTPFKIGIQSTGPGYSEDDSHAFKVIANTSFTMAGPTDSETLGMMRFQGCYSGVLAANNVLKGFQSMEVSPLGVWFSYADPFGNASAFVAEGRTNVWDNGLIYIRNKTGSTTRPKVYWDSDDYDIANATPEVPDADEIVWSNYTFDWSARVGSVDPFPTSAADGLNAAITTKSVYVRGITDLAGDDDGDAVSLAELPIGYSPLRDPE